MTPERLKEMRLFIEHPGCQGISGQLARELLAEVDRLEAVLEKVRAIASGPLYDTRPTLARLCDRPLDSPPAKR